MYKLLLSNENDSQDETKLVDGYTIDFYDTPKGLTKIGEIVQSCKYKTHTDFPTELIEITIENIKKFITTQFDYIMFIPPTQSGNKVKNFAQELSNILDIPLKKDLTKVCGVTRRKFCIPQKYQRFEKEKQKIVFGCINCEDIKDKSILLVDDVCDSGYTLKTAGKFLTKYKPKVIVPLTITKSFEGRVRVKEIETVI